jgi:hypothetical protein
MRSAVAAPPPCSAHRLPLRARRRSRLSARRRSRSLRSRSSRRCRCRAERGRREGRGQCGGQHVCGSPPHSWHSWLTRAASLRKHPNRHCRHAGTKAPGPPRVLAPAPARVPALAPSRADVAARGCGRGCETSGAAGHGCVIGLCAGPGTATTPLRHGTAHNHTPCTAPAAPRHLPAPSRAPSRSPPPARPRARAPASSRA